MRLIISQRLVHKLVPENLNPQEIIPIEGSYKELVKKQFGDLSPEILATLPFTDAFHAQKPSEKYRTGEEGRIAVFEMLQIDKDIEKAILEKNDETQIQKIARSKGMLSLKEDAFLKSMAGLVPFRETMGL